MSLTTLILIVLGVQCLCLCLIAVLLFKVLNRGEPQINTQEVINLLDRVKAVAKVAEGTLSIARTDKNRVEHAVTEASHKAAEVATLAAETTKEKAEDIKDDIKGYLNRKVEELTSRFSARFEKVDKQLMHVDALLAEMIKGNGPS